MDLASITLFDYTLLAVLILFVVHGLWAGFFRQLPFVIALVGSYAASCRYAGDLMPHVGQFTESPKIVFGGGFIILLIVSTLLVKLIGKLIRKVIQVKAVGWGNRLFLGVPLALAKAAVLAVLVIMFLTATLSPPKHSFRDSMARPYLEQGADIIRSFIQDTEIRKDLKPRKASVQQEAAAKQGGFVPSRAAYPQQQPDHSSSGRRGAGADDPASSTEVLK
ncbi:MAG: CvpA family protein [Candidatus Electrothrix sp. AX5]|nr:CvpA family protein [Candidatus Electrothrix sp. AX5]